MECTRAEYAVARRIAAQTGGAACRKNYRGQSQRAVSAGVTDEGYGVNDTAQNDGQKLNTNLVF